MVSKLTHAVGGLVAGLLAGVNPVIAVAGALLPDLDYPLGSLHRKLFHNMWFVGLLYYFGSPALAVGAFSHLVLDSLTSRGVYWFWPVSFPHVRGPIVTGSVADYALAIVLLGLVAFLLFVP